MPFSKDLEQKIKKESWVDSVYCENNVRAAQLLSMVDSEFADLKDAGLPIGRRRRRSMLWQEGQLFSTSIYVKGGVCKTLVVRF